MKRVTGAIVLGLSACGYPLTQLAARRWGVRGAVMAECACAGLAIRDASMVAGGVPGRLRRIPAALLLLELGAGVVASLAGSLPLLSPPPAARTASARTSAAEGIRRPAVAVLFAIHTVRFAIYLRPDQGRRPEQACAHPRPAPRRRSGKSAGRGPPYRTSPITRRNGPGTRAGESRHDG